MGLTVLVSCYCIHFIYYMSNHYNEFFSITIFLTKYYIVSNMNLISMTSCCHFYIFVLGPVTQFTLNSTSGEIKTLAKLNFEQKSFYSLPLRVSKLKL